MQYPLSERIGDPDLLVGREREFKLFNNWLSNIPKRLSKSRAILARRKSGKTAIVQRIFNKLWSENGQVIPFYYNFAERNIWFPDFAEAYYQIFVSQYISFLERDEKLVTNLLTLESIKEYGLTKSISLFVNDVDSIIKYKNNKSYDLLWDIAHTAPHRYANFFDKRILVILDEFQNIGSYIYRDQNLQILEKTLAGSYHEYSESKIAPMLVTGSYIGWLMNLIDTYLEAGRLKLYTMSPYLTKEEGLQAVYKYAQCYDEPITNETAIEINELCMSDPFFISCVMQSDYVGRDLLTSKGVIDTVLYEITDRDSEMSKTWGEYIELTLQRVNDINGKKILLHLSKYPDKEWTPKELKKELGLDISPEEIHNKLRKLAKADVIDEGSSDIDYHGLKDGTLNLILRNRFEKEISSFEPDLKKIFQEEINKLKKDKKSLQGKLNQLIGKFAEYQLATDFKLRKNFPISTYFEGIDDLTPLNIIQVRMRYKIIGALGKEKEIDIYAESECGRIILIEVKKKEAPSTLTEAKEFLEKIVLFKEQNKEKLVLSGFFSVSGFSSEALTFLREHRIGTSEKINYYI